MHDEQLIILCADWWTMRVCTNLSGDLVYEIHMLWTSNTPTVWAITHTGSTPSFEHILSCIGMGVGLEQVTDIVNGYQKFPMCGSRTDSSTEPFHALGGMLTTVFLIIAVHVHVRVCLCACQSALLAIRWHKWSLMWIMEYMSRQPYCLGYGLTARLGWTDGLRTKALTVMEAIIMLEMHVASLGSRFWLMSDSSKSPEILCVTEIVSVA